MQKANQILQAIRKMGEKQIPLTRVYRNLFREELFLLAYDKVGRNKGALTPGSAGETADGMTMDIIRRIIQDLRYERFRFRPARRTHVPKKSGGQRSLGTPDFPEKLVQEVLRLILEAYYEPRFRDSSHGFRKERGIHTALKRITQKFRGTAWLIEGDIRGCFDNIDHDVLLDILSKDIQDGRLLNLIRLSLKAGAVEEWKYLPSYSGTPQGGVLSPLLSNIYLHELDVFIEDVLIPKYTCGATRERCSNPQYKRVQSKLQAARRRGDIELVQQLEQAQRQLPSQDTHDPNFRRLSYVRYADDFLLGIIGTKAEAEVVKTEIGTFLKDQLRLEMNTSKTLITHARTEHARFLGYAISIYLSNSKLSRSRTKKGRRRSVNGLVRLGIPYGLTKECAKRYQRGGKPVSEPLLVFHTDAHIINTYQERFRGLANFYQYAVDRFRLYEVRHVMQAALVKTLAHKHRMGATRVYQKYRGRREVDGKVYRTLEAEFDTPHGKRSSHWGAVPLTTIKVGTGVIEDTRHRETWMARPSDLIQRLQAEQCELCGATGPCEVHHVRKLADLKKPGRKMKPAWMQRMIAIRRKTLVVCFKCHRDIHAGRPTPIKRK